MAIPFNLPSEEQTESNYRSMDDLLYQLYHVLRQILVHREPPVVEVTQRNNNRSTTTSANSRLVEPSVVAASVATTDATTTTPVPVDTEMPRLPLPDIVQCSTPTTTTTTTTPRRPMRRRPTSTSTSPLPPPRRARRRRAKEDEKATMTTTTTVVEAAPVMMVSCDHFTEPGYRQEVFRKVEVRDNWAQVGEDLRKIADEFHHSASLQDEHDQSTAASASNQKGVSLLSLLLPAPFNGSIWMAMFFLLGWNVLQRAR